MPKYKHIQSVVNPIFFDSLILDFMQSNFKENEIEEKLTDDDELIFLLNDSLVIK
tara:strand:+ start:374 stop:538 length:165 start_codon:yes stop_codon:yes gene_type:complete